MMGDEARGSSGPRAGGSGRRARISKNIFFWALAIFFSGVHSVRSLDFRGQSGRVSGTPREDDAGEYSISIIVTDGVDAAVQEYVLTVNE